MNSKYAPVIALTVVVILIVAALGWFLAIKPRFSEAANIRATSESVDANSAKVGKQTAKLDSYQKELAALEPLDDSLALNVPQIVTVDAYSDRINTAIEVSGAQLVKVEIGGSVAVTGWQIPSTSRVSNTIATLFATGPVTVATEAVSTAAPSPSAAPDPATGTTGSSGGYTPVVVVNNEVGPVVDDLQGLPISIEVTGTYAQTVKFIKALTQPEAQIFVIDTVAQDARNKGAAPLTGIPDAKDGDLTTSLTGSFYFLDADTTIVDDDPLAVVTPSGTSPFAPSKPAAKVGK